jgi:hypothetical protein
VWYILASVSEELTAFIIRVMSEPGPSKEHRESRGDCRLSRNKKGTQIMNMLQVCINIVTGNKLP